MEMARSSARLVPVSDGGGKNIERGSEIKRRRLSHGIKSIRKFHEESGVSKEAITAAEAGTASPGTYERLEAWLALRDEYREAMEAEAEMGEAGEPHLFSMTVRIGALDWQASGSGRPEDADLIREQLEKLMDAAMRRREETD